MSFFTEEVRRDPYPLYEQVRQASPVLHNPAADLWLVFDYDGVRRVLTDQAAFSSAVSPSGVTGQWMIFTDPPRHAKLRALVTRAFTARAVADLDPRIRTLSAGLLDPLVGRDEIDLVADYAVPLPLLVIAEMLGATTSDVATLRRWSDVILGLSHSVAADARAAAAEEAFRAITDEMRAYLREVLAARRATPRDDLFTRLREAEVDGVRLSDDEILGFFQLLLVAGHETTTNLVSNAMVSLLEHPGELARLRADPSLLTMAIEEVLRYRSPVQATFRRSRVDVEMAGQVIPAGKLVLPIIGSANRDPAHFVAPDRFDVARSPNPHLAFGHGIHACVGAPLSRLEARVALPDLLGRMQTFELVTPTWAPREAFHVHGPAALRLRVGWRAAGA
jgi:cytochrome P450